MGSRDYRDIVGGVVLLMVGGFAAAYALVYLRLGTIDQMGPGLFPAALGLILAGLGIGIAVSAWFRCGTTLSFDLRSLLAVLASIVAFAVVMPMLGMIPAIAALIVTASLAETQRKWIDILLTFAVLSAVATVIFRFGLGLPVPIFRWPG